MNLIPASAQNSMGYDLELPPLPTHGKEEQYLDSLTSLTVCFFIDACAHTETLRSAFHALHLLMSTRVTELLTPPGKILGNINM